MKMTVSCKKLDGYIALCDAYANVVKGTAVENDIKQIVGLIAYIRMFAETGETVKFENDNE